MSSFSPYLITSPYSIASLKRALSQCLLKDRFSFHKRLQGVHKLTQEAAKDKALTAIAKDMKASIAQVQQRFDQPLHIDYPDILPVSQKRDEIAKAILEHQVVIIAGETGSGKTTQLPKICAELGRGKYGMIGHTQPRRLAARSVANRIAQETQSTLGTLIGYKVRFNDQVSEHTQIKLMTDGILLAEIQHDRYLNQYDTIIIDEAHERSLNIDFILGYLKQLLPRRPDLKLIITSATIDPQRFSAHFDHAPIIEVSGRTYPVETRYRPLFIEQPNGEAIERDGFQAILDAVDELCMQGQGDILIFMNGEREIRDTAQALSKQDLKNTEIVPLYARLSAGDQQRIFQPHSGRRIVLATNVAETSLTVPGIKYVIDPGTARISRYSYRTKVQRLPIEPISQASANQRKGRCGRTEAGICIRLYSEQDFLSRPEFTDPEILRTHLASVILQMTALGLGDIEAFPFVEAPDKRNIQDGVRLLEELGAITTKGKKSTQKLTAIGKQLARLPIDPRLARMVLAATQLGCLKQILIIVAAISIQDPRERPSDKQQAADEKHRRFFDEESDFTSLIKLWDYLAEQQKTLNSSAFRRQCQKEYLNYLRVREWQDLYVQLHQVMREMGYKLHENESSYQAIHTAILTGLLSHIGEKDQEKHHYQGARNAKFELFPASNLFKKPPKWVMAAELVETSKLWARMAAKIQPEWIEPLAEHLIKRSYSEPHWSKKQQAVMAYEKVSLYGLPIVHQRKVNYGAIEPNLCREIFIRSALVEGDWYTKHTFFAQNRALLAEVEALEHKSRRRDILVDDDELFDFYDQRVGLDVVSGRHFDAWWKKAQQQNPELLSFEKNMLMKEDANQVSELDYPNFWYQNEFKLPLSYQFEPGENSDGVTIHIPLAILNQIQAEGFDWQIPGLRLELVISLLKSLPKAQRKNFVPVPNYAQAFLAKAQPNELPLLDSLEKELLRMTGCRVARDEWNWGQVADHLKMTFRVVDHQHKKIQESKNLDELKLQLAEQVQQNLSHIVQDEIEQQGLCTWSFGDLPQVYQQKQAGFEVKAYPALVDQGQSVAIKLFDSEQQQQAAMQAGLRRLLLLNVPSPVKYLQEHLPNKAKLGLYFNTYGQVLELINDCIDCAIDKLIEQHGGVTWTEQSFAQCKEYVRAELGDTVLDIAQQVETILTTAFAINKRLKGKIDLSLAYALSDIQSQLNGLIFKGFVTVSGWQRLPDILRYLKGIERRLEKLALDINKDRVHMSKITALMQRYQTLLNSLPKARAIPAEVQAIRWMLEELRISFFAQQLGTAYPISEKRIMQVITSYTG